ncbi:hypothetical protein ETB97_009541 [Aspergillus alliaceus]|uniref:Uncharacterized protein n=1 Tax=Petromyces alliaceus TaxID=209559 RepID=A0A5N7CMU1_PETAA|nr:hypothetical protein BDV23DRAFT_178556 [Aspergillus alliaceus]KAF5855274.1 hypothetical protein ETB97_009541 [Aspergillus burnettii]
MVTPYQRPPPKIPSQKIVGRWEQGATNPTCLTFDERQQILKRYPYGRCEDFCKAHTGLTIEELVQKAARTDNLSRLETNIILWGPSYLMDNSDPDAIEARDVIRWPVNVRDTYIAVKEAILTDIEKKARANANKSYDRHKELDRVARDRISLDDLNNIRISNNIPWMTRGGNQLQQHWGFVCIRTSFHDDSAWRHFQYQFREAIDLGLTFVQNHKDKFWTPDSLKQRWKIQWAEDPVNENAVLEDICGYFRKFRDEGKIEPGLRQDTFFYVDAAAIQSSLDHCPLPERGYVLAADAFHDATKLPTYLYGFKGSVRVALTGAFTTFHARLIPRGSPKDDPTAEHNLRQSWEVIYKRAKFDQSQNAYPPPSAVNRGWYHSGLDNTILNK